MEPPKEITLRFSPITMTVSVNGEIYHVLRQIKEPLGTEETTILLRADEFHKRAVLQPKKTRFDQR